MKKLKIISLCFLISLLFIPKINASVINHYTTLKYSESNLQLQEQYSDELELVVDYVKQHGIGSYSYSSGGQYAISIRTDQLSSNNFNVTLFKYRSGSGDFYNIYRPSDLTNSYVYMYISRVSQSMSIVNGSVVPIGSPSASDSHFQWNYDNSCDPREYDCILYDNTHYFAYDYLDDTIMMPLYNVTYNNPANIGIKIGDTDYSTGSNIPMKEFFDNISPDLPNPYKCNIDPSGFRTGVLQNVSDVSFRVRGSNVVSEYPLEGSFALQNTSFTATDSFDFVTYIDLDIIKGDESDNTYNVSGTKRWDNSTKTFTIDYKITPLTDNATIFDVIFKISPNSNVVDDFFQKGSINVFDCQPLNVYVDNSYGYTDNNTGATVSTDTGLMNILNNANSPDLGFFNNLNTLLPPGPIDSILNIPMAMFSAISNFLSDDCQPLNITLPWVNQQVQLKCIRSFYSDINATTFIEGVGSIASVIILVQYFIGLYNWFDDHIQLTHKKVKTWGGD